MKAASFKKGRAWIELDMGNLRHNIKIIKDLLPEECELMPSVKANAHGHGAAEICRELNNTGVRAFCVASAVEGAELRKSRVKGDILVFGYTHPEHFSLLKRYRLTQSVVDFEYATKLNSYGKKLKVHVKIDTGMNRLGESSDNTGMIMKIFDLGNLEVTGVYSHFCAQNSGDKTHTEFSRKQLEKFDRVLQSLAENGYAIPKKHLQGSYGIFSLPDLKCDCARPGMALYGVHRGPRSESLRPVLSVKARISSVKTIHEGDTVSYELAYIAKRETKVAALAIGYADGLPRALSCGKGRALINGRAAPILGNICMDQCVVDVTGIENVRQGDTCVILGRDGDEEISAYDIAEQSGTIPNEILGRLGSRLDRVIIQSAHLH